MKKKQTEHSSAAELRRLAEERLREKPVAAHGVQNEADLRRLQHELEVHQIELEMQNEELRRAQAETKAALEKYTDLYDFAPTGYFSLAVNGTILAVNLAGARLVGIERARLLNRCFADLILEADQPTFHSFLHRKLLALLERHDVFPFESVGVPFNPAIHEAVTMARHEGSTPGTVVEELRCGYLWKDELLRPAQVRVAG